MKEIEEKIKKELGEVKIGPHVEITFSHLNDNQKQEFWEFISKVKNNEIKPFVKGDALIFRKPFGGSVRSLIIKAKQGEFSEIFLGTHKYYDEFRKRRNI